jgi:hypothetical protein
MIPNEKGRPAGGDPIPNIVYHDEPESISQRHILQVIQLTRRCAISAATAAILAPLIFGEVSR